MVTFGGAGALSLDRRLAVPVGRAESSGGYRVGEAAEKRKKVKEAA